jgi:putative ABC transport system permease protein
MLLIYFRQAWRAMRKNKTYSGLNIIGLATSLTCFVLIAVWVMDETSYDKFNANYHRIYRIVGKQKTQSEVLESAVTSAPMAAALKSDHPEVEEAVRMRLRGELTEHNGQQLM